jgi:acetyltransferase-like isoleucine patch superfamily enzyme
MMKRIIEKIVGMLKGDHSYRLDPKYSSRQLMGIVYYRGLQVLRGAYLRLFISSRGIIFAGRGVTIQFGYLISAGKSLILEDHVAILALSEQGVVLGDHVTIARSAVLSCTGVIANKGVGISIGSNSAVGAFSFLGGQGGIRIGSDVIMGPYVKIFSENHNYADPRVLIRTQGVSRRGVIIENNCWIGAGATVLDGVTIGSGCVVAAGAVVTQSMPANSLIAGVPARVIKPLLIPSVQE